MVGRRSAHRQLNAASRHLKQSEDELVPRERSPWRLRGKQDLDVSPSKSSGTSALSYSSTLINTSESLSTSSAEAACNGRARSNEPRYEIAPSSDEDRTTMCDRASRSEPFGFDETAFGGSPSSAAHGLSPVSLAEDSIISWSGSTLQKPYESLIDSKPSLNSTDDDNDTIQAMRYSTSKFQSVGTHQGRPRASTDTPLFPTMFASNNNNPFYDRYAPVALSNVGQTVSRFQGATPAVGQNHTKQKKHTTSPEKSSDYVLKSLSPARNPTRDIDIRNMRT